MPIGIGVNLILKIIKCCFVLRNLLLAIGVNLYIDVDFFIKFVCHKIYNLLLVMKILKSAKFTLHKEVVEFIVKNNIQRDDIFIITETTLNYTLFYYSL